MSQNDSRIDQYISKSAAFAQPVLKHLRKLVHQACPGIQETMKWSFPHFDYLGNVCSMASFKNHCAFGFWKASIMKDNADLFNKEENSGMGSLGKISSTKDLPDDKTLLSYIKEAVELNEKGIKLPPRQKTTKEHLLVPAGLAVALRKNKKAHDYFEQFSPSHKREYIEWINEAKMEATREKRIETTIEMLVEGKNLNWKYQRK